MNKLHVSIVGGSGYTGSELLRWLVNHPHVEIDQITSRQDDGKNVTEIFPFLPNKVKNKFVHPDNVNFEQSDLIFFATPNGIAMNFAEMLVSKGKRIIDLAADFRIKNIQLWEQWYGMKHACPKLVETAVYGLSELKKNEIKNAKIVANPGCYPTAIQLALYPLLDKKIINEKTIVIDAKSGISGAGKKNDDKVKRKSGKKKKVTKTRNSKIEMVRRAHHPEGTRRAIPKFKWQKWMLQQTHILEIKHSILQFALVLGVTLRSFYFEFGTFDILIFFVFRASNFGFILSI